MPPSYPVSLKASDAATKYAIASGILAKAKEASMAKACPRLSKHPLATISTSDRSFEDVPSPVGFARALASGEQRR